MKDLQMMQAAEAYVADTDRDVKARRRAVDAVNGLVALAQTYNIDKVIDAVKLEHRTNQQALAGLVFALIHHWSRQHKAGYFDPRNECALEICTTIVGLMEDRDHASAYNFSLAKDSKRPLPCI